MLITALALVSSTLCKNRVMNHVTPETLGLSTEGRPLVQLGQGRVDKQFDQRAKCSTHSTSQLGATLL